MKPMSSISLECLAENNLSVQLLIVDDEERILSAVTRQLSELPVHVITARNTSEARQILKTYTIDIALVDHQLGEAESGLEFLAHMSEDYSSCFRIIFTGEGDFTFAVEAINRGHIDAYLAKPWSPEQLQTIVRQGATSAHLRGLNIQLTNELAQRNHDLEKLNQNLEEIVASRTEELAQTNSRLHIYQDDMVLLETQAAVSQLVRGLAHELNNPLGVILGHAQRLKRHYKEKINDGMGVIEEEVERCRKLIERLRSYAIIDGQIEENCSIEQITNIASERLHQRGVSVPQIHIEDNIPLFPAGARTFGRVFDQIISNAIAASANNIHISHTFKRDRLLIHIDNDGTTPNEDEIRNAIKPFYSNKDNATGLGLSIASALLGEHGCTICFDAHPQQSGARCTIQLAPLESIHQTLAPQTSTNPEKIPLLIIDDEPLINELITEACKELPVRCHCTTSISGALEHLKSMEFAAVIIDANLPDGNGCKIVPKIISQHPMLKNHIALLTGDPNQPLVLETKELYQTPVLSKPFSMHDLTAMIKAIS
ncbi:MAG: response regulator [Planctomycetes bacterium]|nr:response regulator [Planctomycetota bacterium]